jgi:hypothetical protein
MKSSNYKTAAFSLVEVTLALGVAAFCMIAVFGLLPVGVQTNQRATSQTAATSITANVIADLRSTPPSANTSAQYQISFGTSKILYFDSSGRCSTDLAGSIEPDGSSWTPPIQTRYQLNVTFPWTSGLTYGANLKLTWPAAATVANANGSTEIFAAIDRN